MRKLFVTIVFAIIIFLACTNLYGANSETENSLFAAPKIAIAIEMSNTSASLRSRFVTINLDHLELA